MFEGKPATFKGSNEGVVLYIYPEAQFDFVISYLTKFLEENKLFFSGASIVIDAPEREFSEEEIIKLEDVFKKYAISFRLKGMEKVFAKEEVSKNASANSEKLLVIPHTLRSGQAVNFDGNVVILGNVNEGAQIEAGLDVYVFGIIKGIINAGRRVVSLGFQPLRMSIGKKPFEEDLTDKSYKKPRVIEIEGEELVIKPVGEPEKKRRGKI